MRYCTNCQKLTAGEPSFCNSCGRSFDVRLCPSRHPNPRAAQVCATCGSRDLSTPHPRIALWSAPLVWILTVFPGILLLVITVMFFVTIFEALAKNQEILLGSVFSVGLVLGLLWFIYMNLPGFLRGLVRKLSRFGSKRKDEHSQ